MYYLRAIKDSWLAASKQFPVLLLTGPRQVGKTTFLQHICEKERHYVSLDDPTIQTLAHDDPALFFQRFTPPLLIDEIQYAPQLLPYIKMMADAKHKPGQFWLTGSQQFHMMKGVSETLAGRVAIMNMLGFSNRERHQLALNVPPFMPLGVDILEREKTAAVTALKSIYEDIWLGSFPALAAGIVTDRDLFYSSYLQTYLQRDVKDLTQVGSERTFLRFLRACAAHTGQLLNVSELARDTDISINTAKQWLSILQTSFQIYLLQPYHTNVTKRLIKTPKLYFLDTGLCAYLTEWASPQTLEAGAMSGAILESYVFSEILKTWWHQGKRPRMYYYRDKDKREIDFLFEQDMTLYPVEVKKSASPRPDWIKSFSALDRLGPKIGDGGVICLCPQTLPLTPTTTAIPVGCL
ncbi:MAG: ATP-binding protein [Sedimentisphaerales bacterium]|nr:ATP-binding protein [Sedimentisphaerales bacterium]